jgi:hypothetical protein
LGGAIHADKHADEKSILKAWLEGSDLTVSILQHVLYLQAFCYFKLIVDLPKTRQPPNRLGSDPCENTKWWATAVVVRSPISPFKQAH